MCHVRCDNGDRRNCRTLLCRIRAAVARSVCGSDKRADRHPIDPSRLRSEVGAPVHARLMPSEQHMDAEAVHILAKWVELKSRVRSGVRRGAPRPARTQNARRLRLTISGTDHRAAAAAPGSVPYRRCSGFVMTFVLAIVRFARRRDRLRGDRRARCSALRCGAPSAPQSCRLARVPKPALSRTAIMTSRLKALVRAALLATSLQKERNQPHVISWIS